MPHRRPPLLPYIYIKEKSRLRITICSVKVQYSEVMAFGAENGVTLPLLSCFLRFFCLCFSTQVSHTCILVHVSPSMFPHLCIQHSSLVIHSLMFYIIQ